MQGRLLIVLFLFVLLMGCDDELPKIPSRTIISPQPTEPSRSLGAETNKRAYGLYETINIRIYNGSDSIVYLNTCNRSITFYLQKKIGGNWKDIQGTGISCVGFVPVGSITLFQRQSYYYSIGIVYHGEYRFRFPSHLGTDQRTTWIYTNEITIESN